MTDPVSVSGPIADTGKTLSFEAGKLAQLANGAVVARIGDTVDHHRAEFQCRSAEGVALGDLRGRTGRTGLGRRALSGRF